MLGNVFLIFGGFARSDLLLIGVGMLLAVLPLVPGALLRLRGALFEAEWYRPSRAGEDVAKAVAEHGQDPEELAKALDIRSGLVTLQFSRRPDGTPRHPPQQCPTQTLAGHHVRRCFQRRRNARFMYVDLPALIWGGRSTVAVLRPLARAAGLPGRRNRLGSGVPRAPTAGSAFRMPLGLGGNGINPIFVPAPLIWRRAREVGVAEEDPAAVGPRPERILAEPAPDRRPGDLRHQTLADRLGPDVADLQPRERQVQLTRPGADERLHRDDQLRGKRPGASPGAAAPPTPPDAPRRSACATCSPLGAVCPGAGQSHRCAGRRRRGARSWPARHPDHQWSRSPRRAREVFAATPHPRDPVRRARDRR